MTTRGVMIVVLVFLESGQAFCIDLSDLEWDETVKYE